MTTTHAESKNWKLWHASLWRAARCASRLRSGQGATCHFEPGRREVTERVVNTNQLFFVCGSKHSGSSRPNEERCEEPWPHRHCNGIDLIPGSFCIFQSLEKDRGHILELPPCRNLWHDSMECFVITHRARNDVREHNASILNDSC